MYRCHTYVEMCRLYAWRWNVKSLVCPSSRAAQLYEYTNVEIIFRSLWVMVFLSQQTLTVSITITTSLAYFSLSLRLLLTLPLPVSSSPSQCTEAIVKHWPESQALRRLRGSGLTDRWISPQAPRTGIVQEAFLSHWDPCGLRIPGFWCNNQASHTAKRKYSRAFYCFICRCCALLDIFLNK